MTQLLEPPSGRVRRFATGLLVFFAGTFITLEVLLLWGAVHNPWWRVLATGCEAATVGALADWYAVRALFKEFRPLRLRIPPFTTHSNLILKNRSAITNNIAEMVQNKWLSAQAIGNLLQQHKPVDEIIHWLEKPGNLDLVLGEIGRFISLHAKDVDSPEAIALLEEAIRRQLEKGVGLFRPFANFLEGVIAQGKHDVIWDGLIGTMENALRDSSMRNSIKNHTAQVVRAYGNESFLKKIGVTVGEWINVIDYDVFAEKVVAQVAELAGEIRNNKSHPLRQKLDQSVYAWVKKIASGDPEATASLQDFWQRNVPLIELRPVISGILGGVAESLAQGAQSKASKLMEFLRSFLLRQIEDLKRNSDRAAKANTWLTEKITMIIAEKRDLIGQAVKANLEKLSDTQWVEDIETKVGDDLQWIRINGALIGGIVGLLIGLFKYFAGAF